jgi:hypothetical protein
MSNKDKVQSAKILPLCPDVHCIPSDVDIAFPHLDTLPMSMPL